MLLKVAYDYGQLYIYDAAREFSREANEYLDALDAATAAGLTVGVASGLVDVLMPRQENFAAALELSVVQSPPSVIETADHVVEFDLDCSGRVALEGSGGSGLTEVDVPLAHYRARLSGFDFDAAAGHLSIDQRFRDVDSIRPGINLTGKSWPHGFRGTAVPHGTVFSR